MVQGMAFLSKKGFNPQNQSNRKQVWEAQQASKQEKERLRKRQEQLKREQEEEELQRVTRGDIGGSQAQLRFMYDAPPGMNQKKDEDGNNDSDHDKKPAATLNGGAPSSLEQLTQVKAGDDAAAAAFRRMLAASVENPNATGADGHVGGSNSNEDKSSFKFTPMLQGSTVETVADGGGKANKKTDGKLDNRSALEKAVGKKDRSQNNLSYQQQIERFPQLRHAPMATRKKGEGEGGDSTMMVNFKPLGAQILHVRCLACGIWGHQRGDRECSKSGWDPFALPTKQQQKESESATADTDKAAMQSATNSSILPEKHSRGKTKAKDGSSRHKRGRDKDDEYSEDDSDSRDRRHGHHRRRRRRHYHESSSDDSSIDETYNSIPSSEDSHALKRREDWGYSSDGSDGEDHKKKRDDRKRHHKPSKKKKHRRERKETSKRKKKKHKRSKSRHD